MENLTNNCKIYRWPTQQNGIFTINNIQLAANLFDLNLLRPKLLHRGTVCALGYRINNLRARLNPTEPRYWRCLHRLRINEWNINIISHIKTAQCDKINLTIWQDEILWAFEKYEETISMIKFLTARKKRFTDKLLTDAQNITEELNHYEQLRKTTIESKIGLERIKHAIVPGRSIKHAIVPPNYRNNVSTNTRS